MTRRLTFICSLLFCLINSTFACQRTQLGDPGCSSCDEDLAQFHVKANEIAGLPPGALLDAPIVFQYSTKANGCMAASMVCNPNGTPQQSTLSVIFFDEVNTVNDLSSRNSFGDVEKGPNPTRKSEFRCQAGQWYSVQKANPAKKGLVASLVCFTDKPPAGK
ncbi:unnamed protein product, partial [Mesorhabditis belari]|uniref:Uncharacterized protein n=1 Tax=Mesorhabditis belari TaxID=2138241 RepID=A0AAF3FA04_9BILA